MGEPASGAAKRKYEKPVYAPLGEMAKGVGAACKSGQVPNASCLDGTAPSKCNMGSGDV